MNFETIVNDQKIVISDSKKAKQQDAVYNELKKTLTQETEKKLKNLDAKQIELSKKLQDLKLLINDVKSKMVVSIADNYLVEISKNLKKEIGILKIQEPKLNAISSTQCKTELKKVYSEIKDIEKEKLPNIENSKKEVKEKLKQSLLEQEHKYNNETKDYVDKMKMMLKTYSDNEVKNINKRYIPQNLLENKKTLELGNVLFNSPEELKVHNLTKKDIIKMPLDIDIQSSGNIYIECKQNHISEQKIEEILTAITMKYLNSFSSGNAKLSVFSSNFYNFQKLNALYQSMAAGNNVIMPNVSTTAMQLENFLNTILERGVIISGKLLANNCYDLYGLYDKNINTDSFNIVVLQGAFKELNETTARLLEGLIKGYHTCGVRFIIIDSIDEASMKYKSPEYKAILSRICDSCLHIESMRSINEDKWVLENQKLELVSLEKDVTPQDIYNFASILCKYKETNKKKAFSYEDIGFGTECETSSFEPMEIPVGIVDSKVWNIKFSSLNSPLANLIIGIPGTGKSTMIDTMIINGAFKYSPDELIFRLLDFKEGNSSDAYANTAKIPHVKMLSLNNKKEEAGIILLNILSENEKRISEFKRLSTQLGTPIRSIIEYNKNIQGLKEFKKMPRMVIIIDECQYLFEDENMAKNCEYIIRLGRSQGIHLVLSTQALDSKMRKTMEFVDGRYIFEVTSTDAQELLPRKYVDMIRTDIPKGSYKAFVSNEIKSQDRYKMQTVHDFNKLPKYAETIRNKWNQYPIDTVIVGNKEKLSINELDTKKLFVDSDTFRIPIGENYIDHSIIYMDLNKEKQDSAVLLGTNEDISNSIHTSMMLAAKKKNIKTYVVDGSSSQTIRKLASTLGIEKDYIGDENKYLEILEKVQTLYDERIEHLHDEFDPVLFVINGAQNITSMINDEKPKEDKKDSMSGLMDISAVYSGLLNKNNVSKSNVSGKVTLFNLINNAYKVGIYISIHLDSLSLTTDKGDSAFISSNHKILKNSNYRILFNNVKADCSALLENIYKPALFQQINENMAFLIDEDNNYFKFRVIQYDLSEKGLIQLKEKGI